MKKPGPKPGDPFWATWPIEEPGPIEEHPGEQLYMFKPHRRQVKLPERKTSPDWPPRRWKKPKALIDEEAAGMKGEDLDHGDRGMKTGVEVGGCATKKGNQWNPRLDDEGVVQHEARLLTAVDPCVVQIKAGVPSKKVALGAKFGSGGVDSRGPIRGSIEVYKGVAQYTPEKKANDKKTCAGTFHESIIIANRKAGACSIASRGKIPFFMREVKRSGSAPAIPGVLEAGDRKEERRRRRKEQEANAMRASIGERVIAPQGVSDEQRKRLRHVHESAGLTEKNQTEPQKWLAGSGDSRGHKFAQKEYQEDKEKVKAESIARSEKRSSGPFKPKKNEIDEVFKREMRKRKEN